MIKLPNILYEYSDFVLQCLKSNSCNEKCDKVSCQKIYNKGIIFGIKTVTIKNKAYSYKEVIDAIKLYIKIKKIKKKLE